MNEFTAHYERKLSDGNYGSEGLSLAWTWTNDDAAEMPGEPLEVAYHALRRLVLECLSQSAAERVAWAAQRELTEPPATRQATADDEDLPF